MIYLICAVLFIISIRGLASPKTARFGNWLGILAMAVAIINALYYNWNFYILIALALGAVVGIISGLKVKMTSLPQMVAMFNGLGGLSAVCISFAEIFSNKTAYLEISIGLLIGGLAFSGSMVAFAKLQGLIKAQAVRFFGQKFLNLFLAILGIILIVAFANSGNLMYFYYLSAVVLLLGLLLVLPIGGADMPVVISVLNAYSGFAGVAIGFSLQNVLLIITGSIVGASGAILSYIMCKAMNRSLLSVLFGSFGPLEKNNLADGVEKFAKSASPVDAAFMMENAHKVIIVPGYGMAVAGAQHVLKELADKLVNSGVEVKYAIHPVAGRMPGHMNVLLADANVDYDNVFELDEINSDFASADVAYVIGANDVTNPLAKTDQSSPIYGMPILEVSKAKQVFFVKRSLNSGYSGIDNPLFYADNVAMLYGDAKKVTEEVLQNIK